MNAKPQLSLADPQTLEDPAACYRALREHPLYFDEQLGFFICSHYHQMRRILRDTATFSNIDSQTMDSLRPPPPEVKALRAQMLNPANTLVTNDPPSHTRYRNMVDGPFRPRAIEALGNQIQDIITTTIDTLATRDRCEFVAAFAIPIPILVIADMLGLPRSLAPKIKAWSDASVEPLGMMISDARLIECTREVKEFQDYVVAELAQRRAEPRDDLLTHLVQVTDPDGALLGDAEIVSLTSQFLVAGNETTTNGLAAGMRMLIDNPSLQSDLRAAPEHMLTFVNEVLRLESPVQGLFRVVTRDSELDGVKLPKGSRVMLRFAAANRDPAKYDNPDVAALDRHNAGTHVAFGAGIHHCIGANLAREEMVQSFNALLQRLGQLAHAVGDKPLSHHPSLLLRGLKQLPITYTAR